LQGRRGRTARFLRIRPRARLATRPRLAERRRSLRLTDEVHTSAELASISVVPGTRLSGALGTGPGANATGAVRGDPAGRPTEPPVRSGGAERPGAVLAATFERDRHAAQDTPVREEGLAKRREKRFRRPDSARRRIQIARAGTMSSPPSGFPVSSSHTQTAKTAAVNAMRRPSIIQSLRRDERRRTLRLDAAERWLARPTARSDCP